MTIKAVIFDLGETLLNYDASDINGLFHQGARLTYDYLGELAGSTDKMGSFSQYYRRHIISIKWHYLWSYLTSREFDCLAMLDQKARALGVRLDNDQLQELAWLWYQPLGETVSIEPDLKKQLKALQDMHLKLAIISNTFLPPAVLDRHLRSLNLIDFFPIRIYSSAAIVRKPHRRIYQMALEQLKIQPSEAVMVGDKIREDIKGSLRVGIKAILKRGRVNHSKRLFHNVPEIKTIAELPALIGSWPR